MARDFAVSFVLSQYSQHPGADVGVQTRVTKTVEARKMPGSVWFPESKVKKIDLVPGTFGGG